MIKTLFWDLKTAFLHFLQNRYRIRTTVSLILGLGFLVSCAGFSIAYYRHTQKNREIFALSAQNYGTILQDKLQDQLEMLHFLEEFYNGLITVSRNEFCNFATRAMERYGGVEELLWIPYVPADEISTYEKLVRTEGFKGFQIQPHMPEADAFPVDYIVTNAKICESTTVHGYNIASIPQMLKLLTEVRNSGRITLTASYDPSGRKSNHYWILVPIYNNMYVPNDTQELRAKNLSGFVCAKFELRQLMEWAFQGLQLDQFNIEFLDSRNPQQPLMYINAGNIESAPQKDFTPRLIECASFSFCDRQWMIRLSANSAFYAARENKLSYFIFLLGLILTFGLAKYVRLILSQSAKVEQLVQLRTQELSDANKNIVQEAERSAMLAKEAIAASQAKSDFLAKMSHEIRTPMNAVIGFSDILRDEALTDEQHSYVDLISSAAHNLLNIINDILDFSKIEAGHMAADMQDCCPLEIIENVVEMLTESARKKGLQLQLRPFEPIPDTIRIDPVRIRQCLINLVSNAIKFTHTGAVEIEVSTAAMEDGSPCLQIVVRDSGIGIPADKLDTIFSAFSQGDDSMSRNYGGTGLGLTITKQLILLMGGQISVQSQPQKGSTFTIHLPLSITCGQPEYTNTLVG